MTSSLSEVGRAATSRPFARRSSEFKRPSSSGRTSAAFVSTGAASRPRRCCARRRSSSEVGQPASFGVGVAGAPPFDLKVMVARSRDVARELNAGVGFLLKKNGVDVIWGTARVRDSGAIEVAATASSGRLIPSRRRMPRARELHGQAYHRRDRRAAARLPRLEPDGVASGRISRPCCRRRCPSRC